MNIPLQFTDIYFVKSNKRYSITPRLEPIIDFSCSKVQVIRTELLCKITLSKLVCPQEFFSTLTALETIEIYNSILAQLNPNVHYHITLNANAKTLSKDEFFKMLLNYHNVSFTIELSEVDIYYLNARKLFRLCEKLSQTNIELWLDDFGTHSANFDILLNCPFSGVKLAKEIFWRLFQEDKATLNAVLSFLKLRCNLVVIEGVDSQQKLDYAAAQGCAAQGFHINDMLLSQLVHLPHYTTENAKCNAENCGL